MPYTHGPLRETIEEQVHTLWACLAGLAPTCKLQFTQSVGTAKETCTPFLLYMSVYIKANTLLIFKIYVFMLILKADIAEDGQSSESVMTTLHPSLVPNPSTFSLQSGHPRNS